MMNLEEYKEMVTRIPVSPFGIPIAQTWNQIGTIFDDLGKLDITLFVELGVYLGGLADLLLYRQSIFPNFNYFGVQLDATELNKRIAPKIRIGDVLDQKIIEEINQLVRNNPGAVLIYCDAGNKPLELMTYTNLLRVGDYIRVHDFPGEVSPEFLESYERTHPYMVEINKEKYRELGFSFWKKIS